MTAVFTRIVLRYLAAALVARGFLGADDASAIAADPDIAMAIEVGLGAAIAAVAEGWHWLTLKIKER